MQEPRSQSIINVAHDLPASSYPEAGCLIALITNRRSVSRRNRASWFLNQLGKTVRCDSLESIEIAERSVSLESTPNQDGRTKVSDSSATRDKAITNSAPNDKDIFLVSVTGRQGDKSLTHPHGDQPITTKCSHKIAPNDFGDDKRYLVTSNTRAVYLSKSLSTSIVLDLSPSIVSVSPQGDCVFLDSIFDALKRVLHLLVKEQEVPSLEPHPKQPFILAPKVFVTVIAYTPFVVAKNNQVLIQNRCISSSNIDQVLVEIWIFYSHNTNWANVF